MAIEEPSEPKITIAERIDFEQITEFDILIEAKDDGNPVLSSIVKAHVTIIDVDDQNPVFDYDYYYAEPFKVISFFDFKSYFIIIFILLICHQ